MAPQAEKAVATAAALAATPARRTHVATSKPVAALVATPAASSTRQVQLCSMYDSNYHLRVPGTCGVYSLPATLRAEKEAPRSRLQKGSGQAAAARPHGGTRQTSSAAAAEHAVASKKSK